MSNIYHWEKLTFSKLVGKVNFSEENLKKCASFEEQKGTGKRSFWHYCVHLSLFIRPCLRSCFNLFCSGDKRFLSEFLRKWGWFQGHNERFPKYVIKKIKCEKTDTRFCWWKSTYNNDINIILSLENRCTFLFAKEKTWKRTFNTNFLKIVQKNKLFHPKQQ